MLRAAPGARRRRGPPKARPRRRRQRRAGREARRAMEVTLSAVVRLLQLVLIVLQLLQGGRARGPEYSVVGSVWKASAGNWGVAMGERCGGVAPGREEVQRP